jgi:ankyrin repeat protein
MLRVLAAAIGMIASTVAVAGEPLFDAANAGDTAAIERLLANGAAVDSRDRDHATPLIVAALGGRQDAVALLLAKGADAMARNSGGFTALHAAAYSGAVPVAELLLDNGTAVNDAANKAGAAPLMLAAEEDRGAVAELLITRGAAVGQPEIHGFEPLTRAFWRGHADMVRLLKRHGATCQPVNILGSEANRQQCLDIHD